jgi:hypothetical protein
MPRLCAVAEDMERYEQRQQDLREARESKHSEQWIKERDASAGSAVRSLMQ